MAAADTARLLASLGLDDRGFQAGIRRSLGSLGKLDKGVGNVGRNLGRAGRGLGRGAAILGGAAVAGLTFAAKSAIDFDEAFQGVVKTVDASDAKFAEIRTAILGMSTEMPVAATQLAAIAEAGGQMGVKANDIEAFTKQVAILAATTNVSADDAATALGQLQNVIGLTGDEFDNFAATLVDLGNKGSSTEAQILEIERRSGAAAKLLGIAKSATLGWSAAAANLGLNQELAGTSLQNFYLKTQQLVSRGGSGLKGFAKVAGVNSKQFVKLFRKDASGALEKFIGGLGKLSKGDRLKAVQQFFGKGTGLTRLILGLADSVDKNLNPALDDSTKAWKDAAAAQAEFDKRNATVQSAITRLWNTVKLAAVTIGEGFAPALGRAADKLSAFLKDPQNLAQLKSIGEDIGKAIDRIDFDKLLRTAKSLGGAFGPALTVLEKIADLIAGLPPGVIGGAGALILTDKLTGGAVSGIGGDVIGGLASALAKSLASNIPVFGKAFVQPVFVTNPGFGPGGGPPVPGGGGGGAAGAAAGGTAGAAIFIPDMRAFNSDLARELDKSNSSFAKNVAAELRKQNAKETPWDKILQALGFKDKPKPAGAVDDTGRSLGAFVSQKLQPPLKDVYAAQADTYRATLDAKASTTTGLAAVNSSARNGLASTTAATNTSGSRIVGAIQANRPIVTTDVKVYVTAASVEKSVTTSTRYGESNGSAGGGGGHGGASSIPS